MAELKTTKEVRRRIRAQSVQQITLMEVPQAMEHLAAHVSKREFDTWEALDQTRRFLVQLIDDCNNLEEENEILRKRVQELGGQVDYVV